MTRKQNVALVYFAAVYCNILMVSMCPTYTSGVSL